MKDLLENLTRLSIAISAQKDAPIESRSWLELLGKVLGCDWATYWKVNQQTLFPAATWHSDRVHPDALEQQTGHPLGMSEGNAGLVWRSQKPVWSDLVSERCAPRSLNARAARLSAGVWFALKTDKEIFGVIELLSGNLPQKNDQLLDAVEKLGVQIGYGIERAKRGPTGRPKPA